MDTTSLPIPLAKALLALIPPNILQKTVVLVLQRVRSRRPKLFANLAHLQRATVLLAPTDIPHHFVLEIGSEPVRFYVKQGDLTPDAAVYGRLEVLIDMLEGRADGDTLFFSRNIKVTGDTSAIVALRNTLDREEIDLFTEILSLCGPFSPHARLAIGLADRVAQKVKARLCEAHSLLNEAGKA